MRIFLFFFVFCLAFRVFAQDEADFQELEERGYGIYLPSSYDAREEVPLLIALHGFGDEWRNFANASGFMTVAEQYGFIVAFPNGYLRQWNDGLRGDHYEDDVWMLQVMIERVAQDYRINRERIYLAGFSNGGTMVYRAACEAPEIFAGIAAVGGTMRRAQECSEEAQNSLIVIHGTADTAVPFTGGDGRYSVLDTAAFWVHLNECQTEGVPDYDESLFRRGIGIYYFDSCADGEQVMLYVIEDMPHAWPGTYEYSQGLVPEARVNAARIIWEFFELSYQSQQATLVEITPEAE